MANANTLRGEIVERGSQRRSWDRADSSIRPMGSYEELDGGLGREIHFRPPRYPSAELGPLGAMVGVRVGDALHHCPLHNVSQNGVAFEWNGAPLQVGDTIDELTVRFDRHEAYRGDARIGSVRKLEDKLIVGASFLDTLMNVDDVLLLRDVKTWNGKAPGLALSERPWRISGHAEFKALVAEFRLLLEDAKQQLGDLEKSLPWHVVHGDQDSPARAALIERISSEVGSEIVAASDGINASLNGSTPAERDVLKEYSQRHLHDLLMQSPWMSRAREKPLGYPGDYEVMNGLYGNHFAGTTLFGKALNLGFVATGESVRQRKNLIKEKLSDLMDARVGGGRARILSIAAGPAQEIYELLKERESLPESVEIVLFDQDERALAFSYGRLKRLVSKRWPGQVRLLYLHDSIKRLLRDRGLFSTFGTFDAIFSCGLFDYLQPRTAALLASGFFEQVSPGGTVYIGNMAPWNPARWYMEFHLDWHLIYRQHDEMLAFARAGAPSATLAILEEKTGMNPFVTLTRE